MTTKARRMKSYCGCLRLSLVGLEILVVQVGLLHHFRGGQRGLASDGRVQKMRHRYITESK